MSKFKDMMEEVKKIRSGSGLKCLIDSAYKILGNPIVMFNTEYNLLAHTDTSADDPVLSEIISQGTFGTNMQNFFYNEGFIEEVANPSKITLLKSAKLKYDRIWGKLYNKNNSYVANLMIVACNRPFEKHDLMIFEIICKLMTREISRDEFYQGYEYLHQEILIKKLIDKSYDKKLDMGQTEILYESLGPNIYILAADISQSSDASGGNRLRDLFKQKKPKFKYAIYKNYIIVIISTSDETLNVSGELKELIELFEEYNVYAGISGRFENLFELHKYYLEAIKSLSYVLENKCSQRIFPYNINSLKIMQKISEVPSGKGIQYYLNKGPEIFGNPCLFHDMELNLLACTDNMEIIDPIWKELITYGTSSDETIKLFETEGYIHTMESTKGGALLVSDKIKYDRISWRVYNSDKIMIGCFCTVCCNKQFSEDELVLFGAYSQKFNDEIRKIKFYNNYGQVYSETVINGLLSGKIDDYTFYSMDIGNLYNNLLENLYIVVVDTTLCSSRQKNLRYFRDLFNMLRTVNRYAIYSDNTVIIISSENMTLCENKAFGEINEIFKRENIYAGISRCFENIYDLKKHYLEAVSALNYGKQVNNGPQRIFQYNENLP